MKSIRINKKQIALATLFIVALVAIAVLAGLYAQDNKDTKGSTVAKKQTIKEKACGLITLDEAKRIFGNDVKQENSAPTKSTSPVEGESERKVLPSVCSYTSTKQEGQYPTIITVLPVEDTLDAQLQQMTGGDTFKKADDLGDKSYKESGTDLSGKKYHRVVVGYDNAIVTITVGDSESRHINKLVDVMQAKVQDE